MFVNADMEQTEHWYAATTLPRRERFAIENLTNQGFQSFCPLQKTTVRHARRVTQGLTPVFRGYVFLKLDPTVQRWRSVNGTLGIRNLVSDSHGPLPIRRGVVETLLSSVDEKGVLTFANPFKPGDKVRLLAGPFAEQLGIVESLDDNGRVKLLFDLFGRVTRVSVEQEELELSK